MAMNGLPDEDGAEHAGGIFSDINITPLTDIFLVLLIIFMVTTTAIAEAGGQNGGIKVQLPKGGQANAVKEVHDLAIAKYVAGREKDLDFTRALARHAMVSRTILEQRLEATALDRDARSLVAARIRNDFAPA